MIGAQIFTAVELQVHEFPALRYAVPGIVPEGLTLLVGRPKVGKSWLGLDFATAVAAGSMALGSAAIDEPGDVLYCALEDNPRRLHGRMQRLYGEAGWPVRLRFTTSMPRIGEGGVEFLEEWLRKVESPRLIIIDTFARIRPPIPRGMMQYDADYAVLEPLQALASKYGISIVVIHHTRKMDADDPLDMVSGTTGLAGAADSVLVLARSGDGAILRGRGRDIADIDMAVSFDAESCRWTVIGDPTSLSRSAPRQAILETLAEAIEPMSPADIAATTELPPANVRQMLRRMLEAGELGRDHARYYVPRHTRHTHHSTEEPAENSHSDVSDASDVSPSMSDDAADIDAERLADMEGGAWEDEAWPA